jgi:hypothetical protein
MLQINLKRVMELCQAANRLQLAKLMNWPSYLVYKYSHPEKVKALQISTLSQIAEEIAKNKGISPLDVKLGDMFDWQKKAR